jgi:site-specific DNA recombinase
MFVGYLRVSTENQKSEGTIHLQRKEIEAYSKSRGIQIDKFFYDNAISGTKELENRPGLLELFDFIENNNVKNVIIWKLDRLARDLYIQEHIIKQLEKHDIKLFSVKENDLDSHDPMRRAFRQFLGIMSQLEKDFITMRLSAGRLNKAKKGGYSGGGVPLGYKAEGKCLIIDYENADTIKRIFHLKRYKRYSMNKIATTLNNENIPTARNGKWYASTISSILNNKKYTKGLLDYKSIKTQNSDLVIV